MISSSEPFHRRLGAQEIVLCSDKVENFNGKINIVAVADNSTEEKVSSSVQKKMLNYNWRIHVNVMTLIQMNKI